MFERRGDVFVPVVAWDGKRLDCLRMQAEHWIKERVFEATDNHNEATNAVAWIACPETPDVAVIADATEPVVGRCGGGPEVRVPFKTMHKDNPIADPVRSLVLMRAIDVAPVSATQMVIVVDSDVTGRFDELLDVVWFTMFGRLFGARVCVEAELQRRRAALGGPPVPAATSSK